MSRSLDPSLADLRLPIVAALLAVAGTMHAADAQPTADVARGLAGGGRVASLDELFTALDKNHDDKIGKDEAAGSFAQRFAAWDADGDGFATRQEIHDYRQRFGIDDKGQQVASPAPAVPRRISTSADILKEPVDWRLETMPVPPGFAPEVKLKGTEEIRFAPGMFDNTSSTYFTCVLAIVANDVSELGAAEIKDFLEKYYRGLSMSRARRTGLAADAAQMNAVVNAAPAGPDSKNRFTAQIDFFDSFSDGRKITLNVEVAMLPRPAKQQTSLILLVSPSAKDSEVWPTLREIGKKAEKNAMDAR